MSPSERLPGGGQTGYRAANRCGEFTMNQTIFLLLGVLGLVEIILFIVTVAVVYAYAWRRGGLDWD